MLKRIIEKLGCEILCIEDGNKVGSTLIRHKPDVIFMDLVMPGVDGVSRIVEFKRECQKY